MDKKFVLHTPTYEWTVRLFDRLRKLLGINIKLHSDQSLLTQGEIFLFNHFARTETFLPHYVIYKETGAFCRCIATKAIFNGNETFRNYLTRVGVISNDHDELLPLLVAEIIRGRKVVIFPEGGMVKDRRVLDGNGRFSIYSKKAQAFRKHHTGAAVLAIAVDTFKQAILSAEKIADWQSLDEWVDMLKLKNRTHLLFAAHKPTKIIPGNITFYPISTDENFLHQSINLFGNELSPRAHEEMLVESNLLLKNTDMDMRLGRPIQPNESRYWWEQKLLIYMAKNLKSIDDFFTLNMLNNSWLKKITQGSIKRSSEKLRDKYMQGIYLEITVNLNHIASTIFLDLVRRKQTEIGKKQFNLTLYLAVKYIQRQSEVHLHRDLRNPEVYRNLAIGNDEVLKKFLDVSIEHELLEQNDDRFILKKKLENDVEFDTVRLENIIQVYANEVAPVASVIKAIRQAILDFESINSLDLAYYRHDDELKSYEWNHHYYSKPRFDEINQSESALESGRPFYDLPKSQTQSLGVVLVHGFLSSPAEVKQFSEKLLAKGYPVYGVRLPGHGTSPVDLQERSWQEWLQAIKRGHEILSSHVDKICFIGFSTGASLSLLHAAEQPLKLMGTIVINPPMKFRNKNMKFISLLHGVSRIAQWTTSYESTISYRKNDSEHPRINYSNIPIKSLCELKKLNETLSQNLDQVFCPCLIIHSSNDPIVTPDSAEILSNSLVSADVSMAEIESDRHGILYEDIGETHQLILDFIEKLSTSSEEAIGNIKETQS